MWNLQGVSYESKIFGECYKHKGSSDAQTSCGNVSQWQQS